MHIGFERRRRARETLTGRAGGVPVRLNRSSLVGLVVTGALIVVCYSGVLSHLAARWSTEANYSHGFLVPFISAWLLWHRRDLLLLVKAPIQGRWLGVALLLSSV